MLSQHGKIREEYFDIVFTELFCDKKDYRHVCEILNRTKHIPVYKRAKEQWRLLKENYSFNNYTKEEYIQLFEEIYESGWKVPMKIVIEIDIPNMCSSPNIKIGNFPNIGIDIPNIECYVKLSPKEIDLIKKFECNELDAKIDCFIKPIQREIDLIMEFERDNPDEENEIKLYNKAGLMNDLGRSIFLRHLHIREFVPCECPLKNEVNYDLVINLIDHLYEIV